jgi:hypothetical protein
MDDTTFPIDRQSFAKLSKEDLQSFGKQAALAYISSDISLNDAIIKIARQHPSISSHQVKRIAEYANQETFSRLFSDNEKYASDKNVEFPVADPGEILQTLNMQAEPDRIVLPDSDYHCGPVKTASAAREVEADVALAREFGFNPVSPKTEDAFVTKMATDLVNGDFAQRILKTGSEIPGGFDPNKVHWTTHKKSGDQVPFVTHKGKTGVMEASGTFHPVSDAEVKRYMSKRASPADRILAAGEEGISGDTGSALTQDMVPDVARQETEEEAAIKESGIIEGFKGFGRNLMLDPDSAELERAFTSYEKSTGKSRKSMSQNDIADYVAEGRGKEKKAMPPEIHLSPSGRSGVTRSAGGSTTFRKSPQSGGQSFGWKTFPKDTTIVGEDDFGNAFVQKGGKVHFWDHETDKMQLVAPKSQGFFKKLAMGGPEGMLMNAQPQQHPEVTHRENMRAMERRVEIEKKKQELVAMQQKGIQSMGDQGGVPEGGQPGMAPPPGGAPMGAAPPPGGMPPGGAPQGGPPPGAGGPPPQGAPSPEPPPQLQKMNSLMDEAMLYAKMGRPMSPQVVEDLGRAVSVEKLKEAAAERGQYPMANPFGELHRMQQKLACVRDEARVARDRNEYLMKEAEANFLHSVNQHVLSGGNLGELIHACQSVPGNDNVIRDVMTKAAQQLADRNLDPSKLRGEMLPYEIEKSASMRAPNPDHPVLSAFGTFCKLANNQPVLDHAANSINAKFQEVDSVLTQAIRHARSA